MRNDIVKSDFKKSIIRNSVANNGIVNSGKFEKKDGILSPVFVKKQNDDVQSVPFYKLFRFATCQELIAICCGVLLAASTGIVPPLGTILYGEFSSLLVDRALNGSSFTPTSLIPIFGGGKKLENPTPEDVRLAIIQDSKAFGLGLTTFCVMQFLVGIVMIDLLNFVALRQIGRIRKLFLKSVLSQDMSWYDTNTETNFANRITEDLDKLKDGIGEKIGIFIYLVMSFVFSVIFAFMYGWKLTLVVLCCAPIIVIATGVVAKVQSSLTAKELESYGYAGSAAEEVLSGIKTVIAFGGEEKESKRYNERLVPAIRQGQRKGLWSGIGSGTMWFIIYCNYALAFWYGITLILQSRHMENPDYTPAILIIVLFGILVGAQNLGLSSTHMEAFAVARGSAATIFSVIDRVPKINAMSEDGVKPTKFVGHIEFKNVHFHYPARADVKILRGINLRIEHGETVALVGSSGCGKSTILQLIQRLYDPISGQVLLDDTDISTLNVQWLRSHLGSVGQEPVLFAGTIKENISYGRLDATQDEIEQAARDANCHGFIKNLPNGYNTVIGEHGAQLSGGQKQRIAIARALIKKPEILLLDEATSALDLHSEKKVQIALDKATRGRTTIIVAHRLSTIKNADRIIVINEGTIVEMGTHDELMNMKGHYYNLNSMHDVELNANKVTHSTKVKHEETEYFSDGSESYAPSSRASMKKSHSEIGKEEQPTISIHRVLAMNRPEWLYITIGCIAACGMGASFPIFAILFGEVYGVLSIKDEHEIKTQGNWYSLMFLFVGIFTGLCTFLQTYMFSVAGVRLTARLRHLTFNSMISQEMGWFDKPTNSVGALCARLAGDASNVQGATGSRIGLIIQACSTLIIGIIVALIHSWKMTVVSIIGVPAVLATVCIESRMTNGAGIQEKRAMETCTKIAVEAISNIRTVASLGKERKFLERYQVELEKVNAALRSKMRLRGTIFSMGQTIPILAYTLALYYGGTLVANDGLEYKTIIKVSEALVFGSWMMGQALAFAPNFNAAKLSAARIFQMLDRVPTIRSAPAIEETQDWKCDGSIKYSDVHFHYPTRPKVKILQGLNLSIQPGQTVALVGSSGCGKSTCIQLIQRLYDSDEGSINIQNKNITRDLTLPTLRNQLGIVSQEPVLFDRTIAENIAYGDNNREVSTDEIISAAIKSNVHNFISSLPLGYETKVGAKGTQLSGGQKQRIAIARALVRNPRILLLDEATSALDTQSEKVVQEALDLAREGRTCITIAHRLATIQNSDLICVIDEGRVAESGTHDELLEHNGLYAKLHSLQLSVLT